MIYMEEQYNNL